MMTQAIPCCGSILMDTWEQTAGCYPAPTHFSATARPERAIWRMVLARKVGTTPMSASMLAMRILLDMPIPGLGPMH